MLFIQKYFKILLALISFLGMGLLALFLNRKGNKIISPPDLKLSLEVLKEKGRADKAEFNLAAEKEREEIEKDHLDLIKEIQETKSKEAEELKKDPAKLANWIIKQGVKK